MASAFKRKDSPYWWIRQKDVNGKWIGKPTKYRTDDALDSKRARSEAATLTASELSQLRVSPGEKWAAWVSDFLHTHCKQATTLRGYMQSWHWVYSFLTERGVAGPSQLTYAHAFDFIGWRCDPLIGKAKKSTALRDVKVLRLVMRHAVRRGWIQGNPCDRMGIARPKAKLKPEMSDKHVRRVHKYIVNEKPWMRLTFHICLHTGCRISEANIERLSFDHERMTITFYEPKGGAEKAFTTILTAALAKIVAEFEKAYRRDELIPPKTASQLFGKFFRKIGLKGYTIHCTRVTFISRLARSDVPERIALKAVNHSSEIVNRVYQRLRIDDLWRIEKAVRFPAPAALPAPDTSRGTP